jgi:hypothetical protein
MNTKRDHSFYKVVATVGGTSIVFNKPDWNSTTQQIWKFVNQPDIQVESTDLAPFSAIVYQIHKFDTTTLHADEAYAFAVQPLLTKYRGRQYMIHG